MSDQLWSEESSQYFIDYAAYFVPDRGAQLDTICALLPAKPEPLHVVELCCGEGLLARTILERFPECRIHGYDGSDTMLEKARTVLQPFGERFTLHAFDLAAADWRSFPWPVQAVVSSLALHHLDGQQKRRLYRDHYRLIDPGGALIIADLIHLDSSCILIGRGPYDLSLAIKVEKIIGCLKMNLIPWSKKTAQYGRSLCLQLKPSLRDVLNPAESL